MAKHVLKNASVTINAVDLSNHVASVTIETTRDEKDVTAMGAVNKEIIAGLGDATITLDVFQDYGAASVDATLFPLSQSNTSFPVIVKPDAGAVSPTNPSYTMQAMLFNYNPLAGAVGDENRTPVTLRNAAQTGLVRATA